MRSLALLFASTLIATAAEENLIKNASFETPAVKGTTEVSKGGDPSMLPEEETTWTHLQAPLRPTEKSGGVISLGLTTEYARTGKQSLFVDFQKVSAPKRRSFLMTNIVPVKAGHRYRVSLWARIDRKRPLSLDQRRPMMRTEIEFFTPDQENQAGDTDYRTQMIPGSLDRLLFTAAKWNEYFAITRAPEDAGFMKVTFRWETDATEGMTDGMIYFDDAAITEVPGGASLAPLDPAAIKPATPQPDEAAAPDAPKEKEKQ